jgi:sugar/nucleoside kinase (ribokinase family)
VMGAGPELDHRRLERLWTLLALRSRGRCKGPNRAVAAARVGAQVLLVGAVGDDDVGVSLLDELTPWRPHVRQPRPLVSP